MSCVGNGYLTANELGPFPFEDGQCLAWSGFGPWSISGGKEGYHATSLEYVDADARWVFSWSSDDGTEIGTVYNSRAGTDIERMSFSVRRISATWIAERHPIANDAQLALQRCFVDAGVFVVSDSIPEGEWPSIGNFSVSSSGQSLGFTLSAGGSHARLSISASSERFPVASGSASWGAYAIVLSSEGIRDLVGFCKSNSVSPPSQGSSSPSGADGDFYLRLCARCVTSRPHGLSSIKVYDGVSPKSDGPHFVLTGDVAIRPGNNMLLSEPDVTNGIVLGAVPGAGMGAVPCECGSNASVSSPLSSTDGHVRIFNDTCYDIEPVDLGSRTVNGESRPSRNVRLHAKCTACCQCSMYESIVKDRLSPIFSSVKDAKEEIDRLLSVYESAVRAFNERLDRPSLSDVTLSLSGVQIGKNVSPKLSATKVVGKMNRCAFTAVFRNMSFAVVYATISSMSATGSIIDSSASWSDADGSPKEKKSDSRGGMVGTRFSVYPGRSLVVSFVSAIDEMTGSVSKKSFTGSIAIGMSYQQGDRHGTLGTIRRTVVA